ncbi:MAG: SRPBCC family protein [Gemmatimonadota bacterium]
MTKTAPLTVSTPTDRDAVITRVVDAPRGMVFDAYTKPELVRRWLLGPPGWTMPVCEIDLRVGGRYRYEWRSADGQSMGMGGTFKEVVRPTRIVATQMFDQDWTGGETIVSTDIVEKNGKSTITTTVRFASREARDAALQTGMTTGMEAGYERLEQLLEEIGHG